MTGTLHQAKAGDAELFNGGTIKRTALVSRV
jgi:hypothetical protein